MRAVHHGYYGQLSRSMGCGVTLTPTFEVGELSASGEQNLRDAAHLGICRWAKNLRCPRSRIHNV
eukprot:11084485-Lingulodinium_polyedra.AAC.1